MRRLGVFLAVVTLLFGYPLAELVTYANRNELHSHALLVPLISAYLLYSRRHLAPRPGPGSVSGSATMGAIGLATAAAGLAWHQRLGTNDYLSLMSAAYVCIVCAGGYLFLGTRWMAFAAFPCAFLGFIVPLPDVAVQYLERASALGSAEAAAWLFGATGVSFVRQGPVFELPGIVLQVAKECSGIRSSWVLLITSLLASYVFLDSPWRRIVLVAFVIPLGILRNGFRILVIGLLCVHVGPHMIDSVIHRRGGPAFFALSLGPLFALLWYLRYGERRADPPAR